MKEWKVDRLRVGNGELECLRVDDRKLRKVGVGKLEL